MNLISSCPGYYVVTIFRCRFFRIGSNFRKIVRYLLYLVYILETLFELIKNQFRIIWGWITWRCLESIAQMKLCGAKNSVYNHDKMILCLVATHTSIFNTHQVRNFLIKSTRGSFFVSFVSFYKQTFLTTFIWFSFIYQYKC